MLKEGEVTTALPSEVDRTTKRDTRGPRPCTDETMGKRAGDRRNEKSRDLEGEGGSGGESSSACLIVLFRLEAFGPSAPSLPQGLFPYLPGRESASNKELQTIKASGSCSKGGTESQNIVEGAKAFSTPSKTEKKTFLRLS